MIEVYCGVVAYALPSLSSAAHAYQTPLEHEPRKRAKEEHRLRNLAIRAKR